MNDALIKELDKVALAHRILEMEGHGDMTQGHISLRDPDGRGFWLKRHGIGLGEVMDHEDFILLEFDGNKIAGGGGRHSEWPIHSEIFKRRPEISVVAHTHPFYTCIFTATGEPLRPLTMDGGRFSTAVPHHKDSPELLNTVELGRNLASSFADSYAVFIGNHGVAFVGQSIEQALLLGVSIERACQAQLVVAASGLEWTWPDENAMTRRRASGTGNQDSAPTGFYRQTFEYYARKLRWAERNNVPGTAGFFRI